MELYLRNRAQADDMGLALLPKFKFEHIHLTSSKMQVDLATQVRSQSKFFEHMYLFMYHVVYF